MEARAPRVEDVAASLVAIHSTDAASVFVASWARLADRACGPEEVERALYEQRTLIRMLAMRRTMFVVDRATAPVVHAAASRTVAARERTRLLKGLDGRSAAWLRQAEDAALAALAEGELTATELAAVDPRLAEDVRIGSGKWSQTARLASRLLLVLSAEGQAIRRGRAAGGPRRSSAGRRSRPGRARRWRTSTPRRPSARWPASGCAPSARRAPRT